MCMGKYSQLFLRGADRQLMKYITSWIRDISVILSKNKLSAVYFPTKIILDSTAGNSHIRMLSPECVAVLLIVCHGGVMCLSQVVPRNVPSFSPVNHI